MVLNDWQAFALGPLDQFSMKLSISSEHYNFVELIFFRKYFFKCDGF